MSGQETKHDNTAPEAASFGFSASRLSELLLSEDMSDVTLLAGPEKTPLPAHRLILAMHSPVFRAHLLDGWSESSSSTVTVEWSVEAVKAMLSVMYGSNTSVPVQTILDLEEMWSYYMLKPTMPSLREVLVLQLDEDTVWGIWSESLARRCSASNACHDFVAMHTAACLQSERIVDMSYPLFRALCFKDEQPHFGLDFGAEQAFFNAVCRWWEHDREGRQQQAREL